MMEIKVFLREFLMGASGLNACLVLSIFLFFVGAAGVMARRNIFVMLIGIEMMLNAANLTLVAYGRWHPSTGADAHTFALFIMAVAAAEICVGLALVICLYRHKKDATIDQFATLKE